MIKTEKRMPQSIIQKCAEVARKCINAFQSDPVALSFSGVLFVISSFGMEVIAPFFIIFIAAMIDVWTGFVEARRNPKKKVNSDNLKKKSEDLLVYWGIMAIPAVMSLFYPYMVALTWLVMNFFLWVEAKSFVENMKGAGYRVKYLARGLEIWERFLQGALDKLSKKSDE